MPIKYVLFKNNTSNDRVSNHKLNKLINIKMKYELLEDL